MTRRNPTRQRGAALIALLAIVAMGSAWYLVSRLNTESGLAGAAYKARNAQVLNRAKLALIGYVAAQAAKAGENRPGALPCPEAAADFNDPANEGTVSYPCTLPKVGRFPWRTLGLDKLVDAAGEPLWYVVSPGWAGANTVINSNSPGQLTIDGIPNDSVALIIAPGPAIAVVAVPGCTAWSQTRPTTGPPDWRNYLECENATSPPDAVFVTNGPSGSFNDQVIRITTAEILPAIEAAIATRIEREIAPAIRSMYNGGSWSGSVATPLLPFAAPFSNPSASAMQGAPGMYQGLLPLVYSETSPGSGVACTAGVAAPRCNPTLTTWSAPSMSGAATYSESCSISAGMINCTYYYRCPLLGCAAGSTSFSVDVTGSNVGMAMRQLIPQTTLDALSMTNVSTTGRSISGALAATGAATVTVSGTANYSGSGSFTSLFNVLCGLLPFDLTLGCLQSTISVPITLLADHPILDSTSTGANPGWFLRNKWHEVSYYAVAAGFAPSGAKSCTNGGTCLNVAFHRGATGTVDAGNQRAILILSGRSLTGAARPNGTLADWLEGANADGASPFELRSTTLSINRSFNDRIAVLDSN